MRYASRCVGAETVTVSRFVSGICLALIVPLTAPMSLVMHLRITSPSKNVESVSAIVEAVLRFA